MKHNNNFEYDLHLGVLGEKLVKGIFKNPDKVEVKTDFKAKDTGNVFVEYESRGKESGLSTTTADYWVYCLWTEVRKKQTYVFIPTDRLKKTIKEGKYKETRGGDNLTSKGYLVPKADLLKLI